MGNSLQDQLIGAGLIDKKRANKLKTEKSKKQRHQRKTGQAQASNKAASNAQVKEAAAKDRELNRRREQRKAKKALAAQMRQLIATHALPEENEAEFGYNFVDQGKVRKIYVSTESRLGIGNGKLAIIRFNRRYRLIPLEHVEKLRQREPDCVVLLNSRGDPELSKEEDAYPEHKIPDDLIW